MPTYIVIALNVIMHDCVRKLLSILFSCASS